MSIPHKLSYPPTPVLCQLTGLPIHESETAAELANCWLFLLAAPFRSPASRAKAVRFSRPAERPRSVNMRSESLDTLVPPRFSARPATTAPPMLRMQEQARHHRVDANRQDPAQPRICVPTIKRISTWWVRRSTRATAQEALGKTVSQCLNGRLVVMSCVFRSKPITDSGPNRSPIPAEIDHRFRSKSIALRRS